MTINKSIFLIILSAFVFFKCSDEPTSIGEPRHTIGVFTLNSNNDSLSQSFSSFHPEGVRLSSSSRILLGKINNEIDASILIKFSVGLADSVKESILNDSINVMSAEMDFIQVYSFGSGQFDFTVHKVNTNWSIDFTKDSLMGLNYDTQNSSLNNSINDSVTTVTLSNQLVQDWLDITADTSLIGNYGIYIKPTDMTQQVLGYQAITQTFENVPVVRVVIEKLGAYTDTLVFTSTADVTVMDGSQPNASPENIVIRAGYIYNAQLSFDLSNVPENIVVNKAELVLTSDSSETQIGSGGTNSLQAYFLFDSTNTDSISSSSVTLSGAGNTFVGNITTYLRAWLDNNNQGILITATNPLNGVDIFSIKGSNTADSNKPLLRLTYTKLN